MGDLDICGPVDDSGPEDEDSSPNDFDGVIQPSHPSSTNYSGVTVNESKDVHVGTKIVFVLNNSSGEEILNCVERLPVDKYDNGLLGRSNSIHFPNSWLKEGGNSKNTHVKIFYIVIAFVLALSVVLVYVVNVAFISSYGNDISAAQESFTRNNDITTRVEYDSSDSDTTLDTLKEYSTRPTTVKISTNPLGTTGSTQLVTHQELPVSRTSRSLSSENSPYLTTHNFKTHPSLYTTLYYSWLSTTFRTEITQSSEPKEKVSSLSPLPPSSLSSPYSTTSTPESSSSKTTLIVSNLPSSLPSDGSTSQFLSTDSTPCQAYGADHYFPLISKPTIISASKLSDGVCLVRRDQLGIPPCAFCESFRKSGSVHSVSVHFRDTCDTFDTCSALVKSYQSEFVKYVDYSDENFLFNFVIGADSRIYEVLGWDYLLSGHSRVHFGIQLWNEEDNLSEKQLYNLMLIVNVGRWCGKLDWGFDVNFICSSKQCLRYLSILKNIRYLGSDKYLMDSAVGFVKDSTALGAKFAACEDYQFENFVELCQNYRCN